LSEGFYPITDFKTKKMGVMTEDGKVLVSPMYDEVGEFRCGMCRVWIAEKGNTQVWDNRGRHFTLTKKERLPIQTKSCVKHMMPNVRAHGIN
jgi:hypothetical protein